MPPQIVVDLKTFAAMWNRAQLQKTPALHFRMADWLQNAWDKGEKRLLLQVFRAGGKSTVVGLFAAWLLYRQPDLRILVLAGDSILAEKMVRNVRRVIERHPLTKRLHPEKPDQWASDRFTVRRRLELRDPSMLGKGITANVTGSRADIIICDDVEVPNTCDTAQKRDELRARLAEIDFVMTPGGTQLYVGTPHTYYTIYADAPRAEIGEEQAFLDGFSRLTIPVVNERGQGAWPERFTDADIARMRLRSGPSLFASQMMLQPANIKQGHLDPSRLQRYGGDLHMSDELNGLYLEGRRLASASAWWDPSFGGEQGDASVLAVVFADEAGEYWLHRVMYIKAPDAQNGDDAATYQCREIVKIARENYLPFIAVETNGIGKFLPAILRREMAAARLPCAVLEKHSVKAKDLRILEAFDAVMAARALHVHESVYKTALLAEMQEWRPRQNNGRGNGRDDGLDAVAGALSLEPVRIRRVYGPSRGGPGWRHGGGAFEAKTEFEV